MITAGSVIPATIRISPWHWEPASGSTATIRRKFSPADPGRAERPVDRVDDHDRRCGCGVRGPVERDGEEEDRRTGCQQIEDLLVAGALRQRYAPQANREPCTPSDRHFPGNYAANTFERCREASARIAAPRRVI